MKIVISTLFLLGCTPAGGQLGGCISLQAVVAKAKTSGSYCWNQADGRFCIQQHPMLREHP